MIREFQDEDTESIISVWRSASAVAHPFLSDSFMDQGEQDIRNIYLKFAETSVTVVNNKVVGFIAMAEDEIGGLFLSPDFHGQGLGRDMVDLVRESNSSLKVEVFEKNAIGRRFYAAYGFQGTETYLHEPSGEIVIKLNYLP
ncbi:MAG: GNAT family N-acetyltransferase [Rhodobacteraceae bacterium]|nr:GNAT family N-acetyltransferase [Paracoccaceae bacterium]